MDRPCVKVISISIGFVWRSHIKYSLYMANAVGNCIFIVVVKKRFLHRFDFVNWASREVARTVDHLFDIFFLTFSCVWFSVSIKLAPLCIGLVIFSLTLVGFSC